MRAPSPEWMTISNLVIIAVAMIVVVIAIWYGSRKRARRDAAVEVREAREDAVAEREAEAEAAERPAEAVPLVAPVPPPLAEVAPVAGPPVTTDVGELGQLKGVGPKLAVRLGELGYTRFDQIAALAPDAAEALDAQLGTFQGRLTRDRWIEQAEYLAKGDRAGFEAAFGKL